jgi:transcriptional regulator with XRE-family HTH domain
LEERELFILYRRRAGVTQTALAEQTGIRQPRISWWESGRLDFSREKVDRLWEAVEVLATTGAREESGVAGAA